MCIFFWRGLHSALTRIGEIVFVQPHLAAGHHVGDDVLLRGVLVDPVGPLVHGDHLASLLVERVLPRLVDEVAALETCDLTPPDIGHLQVCVQQHIESEAQLLAGVVDTDVEVEFLFPQDQAVGNAEP